MKVYHVIVEREDNWFVARALEDASVFTQGRSLDEITENIREVADLLHGERNVQVELVIPPTVKPGARGTKRSRPQPARKR
jgi:predicted RNase H-like HicB family nuclease